MTNLRSVFSPHSVESTTFEKLKVERRTLNVSFPCAPYSLSPSIMG